VTVRLKQTADLVTSCVASEARPFVALEHLESGTGRLAADVELPERMPPEIGAASVEPGDVLFGKLRPYLAKSWLADRPVFASTELLCLRPRAGVDSRWLAYLVASSPVVEWAVATSDGTKMPRTSWEKLAEYRIEIPPLARQRAIADYLDRETARIDALIEKKQRMLTLLEEKFLEAVRNQVTGGISFDDPLDIRSKDVINLRTGWAPVKLGQDLSFGSGTTPRAGDERYYGGHIPWIVTGDLSDDLLRAVTGSVTPDALAEFSALQVHPAGALIVAMYGATVGRLAVSGFPAAVNQACCVMHSGTRLRTWFVFYYLLSHRPVLMERAVGAGQPNISQEILRSLRIPAPDLEVQDRIVAMLNDVHTRVDRLVSTIRTQIGLLQERRQALITAAVTGELEIPGVAT
jgi:type I restriction enzyme S subunit